MYVHFASSLDMLYQFGELGDTSIDLMGSPTNKAA